MPYNDTSQEFLNTLTKHNCPRKWIDEAKAYQKDPSIATSEDMERLYNHILTFILDEEKTTGSVKKEESKYRRDWEDEVERDDDFNIRVADEYGDIKPEKEE